MTDILIQIKLKVESSKILMFDFDGVVADSVEVKTHAFASIYNEYGKDVVKKIIEHHNNNGGMSRFDKFQFYHENFLNKEIDMETINKLSERFSKIVFSKVVSANEINSVSLFLKKYGCNARVCVVNSATPQKEMREIIKARGMDNKFSYVLGSPRSKVDNITKVLAKYSCNKNELLFFGDSQADLNAAIICDVDFIGIGNKIQTYITKMGLNYNCMENFDEIIEV
jgi:phosphoglycolate phosphatase-like HAD superfamily hydrolase